MGNYYKGRIKKIGYLRKVNIEKKITIKKPEKI